MFNSKQRYNPSHGAGGSNSRWHLPPSQFPLGHQSESYNLHQRVQYGAAYGHQQHPFIAPQSMQGGSNGGNFNMQTNGLQAFPGAPPPNTTYGPPGRDYSGPPGHGHYGPPEPEISEEEIEKEMRNLSPELQKAYNDGQKEKARLQILGKTRTAEQRTFKRLSNECKDEAKRDQQRTKLERAADQKSTSMMFDYANNNRKHLRDIDVDGDDSTEAVGRSTKKHRTSGNETEMQDENTYQEYIVLNTARELLSSAKYMHGQNMTNATKKEEEGFNRFYSSNINKLHEIAHIKDEMMEKYGSIALEHLNKMVEDQCSNESQSTIHCFKNIFGEALKMNSSERRELYRKRHKGSTTNNTQFVIKQHEEQQEEMARLKVKCDKQDDEVKKIRGFRVEDLKNQKAELKDIQEQHGVDMEKAESQNKEIVQSKNEIIQSKNEQIQSKEDRINEQIQSKEELATLQRQIIEKYEEEIKSLKKALQEKK